MDGRYTATTKPELTQQALNLVKRIIFSDLPNLSAPPSSHCLRGPAPYTTINSIIPSTNAMVTRQFTINSNRVLGSDYEGDILRKDMDKEAALQIIEHIKDVKR